jgi:RNA polymerase sigma-70 factor, ECF subfamily
MITIARRRAIDRIRRNQSKHRRAVQFELESLTAPEARPRNLAEEQLDSAELRDVIAKILSRIPEKQRETIELTFFGSMSQRKIAASLGLPVGTVKTRLQLALVKVERGLKSVSRELISHYAASGVLQAR